MAESLFDIFGDAVTRQAIKNVSRQPFNNIENIGKTISAGPYKPNEPRSPAKKTMETKKSFLLNTGKALQSTPARQCFTPSAVNVGSFIYNDNAKTEKGYSFEELEFTKPKYRYDNYNTDLYDDLPLPELHIAKDPPHTPPPALRRHSLELLDCSYQDEFYTDDFSIDSIPEMDLNLPDIF